MSKRLLDAYLLAVRRGGVEDPVLARAFYRVAHMTQPPQSLMHPQYVVRVLRSSLRATLRRSGATHQLPDRRGPVRQHHTTGTSL